MLLSNRNVFTEPLSSNGRCLQSHRLAIGLYATIWILKKYVKSSWTKFIRYRTTHRPAIGNKAFEFLIDDEYLEYMDNYQLLTRPLIGLLYQPRTIDHECGAAGGIENWQGKPKYS
jgi:hypothetical protein